MDPSRRDFRPPVGSRVGDYELVEEAGGGHYSVVYLARGPDGGHVALKLLRGPDGHDPDAFEEEREALLKACNAPPAARVVRLVSGWQEGALGGCYCLATTPYCSGGNLDKLIENTPAPPDVRMRLRWALEVAETLQLLHSTPGVRLYHGDVTLRNVGLWRTEGREERLEAFLLDLGVSVNNNPYGMGDPIKTNSASVAPEMEQGKRVFDASADVWSWGVLLYALLSWSGRLHRMGGKAARAWLASLPDRASGTWEHELRGPGDEKEMRQDRWDAVVGLMLGCLRSREERLGLETVLYVMRWALDDDAPALVIQLDILEVGLGLLRGSAGGGPGPGGHAGQESVLWLVVLEERLRRGRAAGGLAPRNEAELLCCKAIQHRVLQQHVDERGCLERALRLARTCHTESPSGAADLLFFCLSNLAALHLRKGKIDEGQPLLEEALEVTRAAVPRDHQRIAVSSANLALVLKRKGDYHGALPLYQEALEISRKADPQDRRLIAACANNLGLLYRDMSDFDKALLLLEEALDIRRKAPPSKHLEIASFISNLAELHARRGQCHRALLLFEEALEMRRELLPSDHPLIALSLNNLGVQHINMGNDDRAMPLIQQGLDIRRATLPPGHVDIAESLHDLATVYEGMGDYDQALQLHGESLAMRRGALPKQPIAIAISLSSMAMAHVRKGEPGPALQLAREALAIRRAVLPKSQSSIARSLVDLCTVHLARGEGAQALQYYGEAHEINKVLGLPDIEDCLSRVRELRQILDF